MTNMLLKLSQLDFRFTFSLSGAILSSTKARLYYVQLENHQSRRSF